jgi:hypothetical protein
MVFHRRRPLPAPLWPRAARPPGRRRAFQRSSQVRRVRPGPADRPGSQCRAVCMVAFSERGQSSWSRAPCERSTIPRSCRGQIVDGWSSAPTASGTTNLRPLSASTLPSSLERWPSDSGRTIRNVGVCIRSGEAPKQVVGVASVSARTGAATLPETRHRSEALKNRGPRFHSCLKGQCFNSKDSHCSRSARVNRRTDRRPTWR